MPLDQEQLKRVFAISGFDNMSPSEQRAKLSQYDDRFSKMDDENYISFRDKIGLPLASFSYTKGLPIKEKSTGYKISQFARPFGSALIGGGAALATGNPALGLAAYGLTDLAFQTGQGSEREPSYLGKSLGIQEEQSLTDKFVSTGEQLGLNTAGAKLFNVAGKAVKGLVQSRALETPREALKATYSQYQPHVKASVSKLIEDLFGNKEAALERSATLARAGFPQLAEQISDAKPLVDPTFGAKRIATGIREDFGRYLTESSKEAEAAKLIAKANTVNISKLVQPEIKWTNVNGIVTTIPAKYENITIEGPVNLTNSIQWAKKYIDSKTGALYLPDEENQLIQSAKNLISATRPKFNKQTGALESYDPISFNQAWEWKKEAGALSSAAQRSSAVDKTSSFFSDLTSKFNKDIDESISNWTNNSSAANQAWQRAKALVAERSELYGTPGKLKQVLETTKELKSKISFLKAPVESVDRMIDDPIALQKGLNRLVLQPIQPGVAKLNIKQNLQSYQLMRIMHDAFKVTDPQKGTGSFDKNLLFKWWGDPSNQASKDILYSKSQKENISEFLEAVASVSDKPVGLAPASKIYLTKYGAYMAGALLAGNLTGPQNINVTIGTSMLLSGMAIGKILTNPTAAKYLNRAIRGEPLQASQKFAGKVIVGALQGAHATLKDSEGNETEVRIGKDGKYEEVK